MLTLSYSISKVAFCRRIKKYFLKFYLEFLCGKILCVYFHTCHIHFHFCLFCKFVRIFFLFLYHDMMVVGLYFPIIISIVSVKWKSMFLRTFWFSFGPYTIIIEGFAVVPNFISYLNNMSEIMVHSLIYL